MNIFEAVTIALKEDRCITTSHLAGKIKIKPTNGNGNCILMHADGSNPSKYGWQPSANELISEDWQIC